MILTIAGVIVSKGDTHTRPAAPTATSHRGWGLQVSCALLRKWPVLFIGPGLLAQNDRGVEQDGVLLSYKQRGTEIRADMETEGRQLDLEGPCFPWHGAEQIALHNLSLPFLTTHFGCLPFCR